MITEQLFSEKDEFTWVVAARLQRAEEFLADEALGAKILSHGEWRCDEPEGVYCSAADVIEIDERQEPAVVSFQFAPFSDYIETYALQYGSRRLDMEYDTRRRNGTQARN